MPFAKTCPVAAGLIALASISCSESVRLEPPRDESVVGTWRAVLESPGGDLPFGLRVSAASATLEGGSTKALDAVAVNGAEIVPFSSVSLEADRVVFAFDHYDSEIVARFESPDRISGEWRKVVPEGITRLAFRADRKGGADVGAPSDPQRFTRPAGSQPPQAFGGSWVVEFTDESGSETARAEFVQNGEFLSGTFLTPTGDYRFLEGNAFGNELRLSTFDGGHAFLFHARMTESGTLSGDFWSRDTYHATWTARPIAPGEAVLPDAWSQVGLTNDEGRLDFAFPDLEGEIVGLDQPRFDGKVVLVNIFGSWCPNCNDEAPLLAEWHRRHRHRGFEVVGLAYEFTGNPERDARQVRRYAERHGIEFPLLLAGVSDKRRAGETLPDLTSVIAYPTSIFIGRDGGVRRVHSGFSGPATGSRYSRLVGEFETLIEQLLSETADAASL